VDHDIRTTDEVCAALERMRREVQDFGVQHVLGKILEDVAAHAIDVHVTPIEPH
jgi:selenophosphate synthetase-related protein